jgi:hypothetical protein
LRVGDQRLTAVITADAVRGLKLRRGDDAIAIVKSTEVMIALPPLPVRATKGNRRSTQRSSTSQRRPVAMSRDEVEGH